jgi:hypothetical protein
LSTLLDRVDALLEEDRPRRVRLRIPQKEGKMLAQLQAGARIYSRQYQDGLVVLEADAPVRRCCGDAGVGGGVRIL